MARIATLTVKYKGEYQKFTVNCASDGVFKITLPEGVSDFYQDTIYPGKVAGTALDAVEREFKKILNEYEQSLTVSRRVIRYGLVAKQPYSNRFDDGVHIEIGVLFLEELTRTYGNGEVAYKYLYSGEIDRELESVIHCSPRTPNSDHQIDSVLMDRNLMPGDWWSKEPLKKIIPWTPDAEKTLQALGSALFDLTEKLKEVFASPDSLVLAVESGGLLPNPKKRG